CNLRVGEKLAVAGEGAELANCAAALQRAGYQVIVLDEPPRRALGNPVRAVQLSKARIRCDALAIALPPAPLHRPGSAVGAGPCQGKSCESAAMRICAQRQAVPVEAQVPFRARPPLMPTAMAEYAGLDLPASDRRSAGLKPTWGKGPHPLQPRERLPEHADVVIIGGGIMGLALAWNLAASGAQKIL